MSDLMKSVALAAILAMTGPALAQDTESPADPGTDGAATAGSEPAGETGETAPDEGTSGDGTSEDETPEPSDDGLAMGDDADASSGEVGRPFVKASFGDWEQRCVLEQNQKEFCQLRQLLLDGTGNPVAEISIFALPEEREAAAASQIVTPLETLLTRQLTLSIDGSEPQKYPYYSCAEQGCAARIGFTDAEIAAMKRGNKGKLVIVPAAAPEENIEIDISLNGFTAGYEAVKKDNAGAE